MSIASQSADNSSIFSSPTSSSSAVTLLMSLSQTYLCKLHTPRHISAHVDWTERRLWMCERRWPLLKVCSMPTEVASNNIEYKIKIWKQSLTRDDEIINCHPQQVRIICTMIMPPTNSINNVLRVRAKVVIKPIMKLCGLRSSKCSHVVKDVVTFWSSLFCMQRRRWDERNIYEWEWYTPCYSTLTPKKQRDDPDCMISQTCLIQAAWQPQSSPPTSHFWNSWACDRDEGLKEGNTK